MNITAIVSHCLLPDVHTRAGTVWRALDVGCTGAASVSCMHAAASAARQVCACCDGDACCAVLVCARALVCTRALGAWGVKFGWDRLSLCLGRISVGQLHPYGAAPLRCCTSAVLHLLQLSRSLTCMELCFHEAAALPWCRQYLHGDGLLLGLGGIIFFAPYVLLAALFLAINPDVAE